MSSSACKSPNPKSSRYYDLISKLSFRVHFSLLNLFSDLSIKTDQTTDQKDVFFPKISLYGQISAGNLW